MNNTNPNLAVEFGLEDDNSEQPNRTVTLFVRFPDNDYEQGGLFTTVKAKDLIKALKWLESWA